MGCGSHSATSRFIWLRPLIRPIVFKFVIVRSVFANWCCCSFRSWANIHDCHARMFAIWIHLLLLCAVVVGFEPQPARLQAPLPNCKKHQNMDEHFKIGVVLRHNQQTWRPATGPRRVRDTRMNQFTMPDHTDPHCDKTIAICNCRCSLMYFDATLFFIVFSIRGFCRDGSSILFSIV